MNTTALVSEFLLIGIVPFLTLVFASFVIFRVRDFGFILEAKDFTAPLVILMTLVIYLLGAVTHKLSQLINMESLRYLSKVPGIRRGIIKYTHRQQIDWFGAYVLILQKGSSSLVEEIQRHESQIRIFKSTAVGMPILAIPLSIWLYEMVGLTATVFAVAICAIITLFSISAFYLQRSSNRNIVKFAIKHFQEAGEVHRDYSF